MLISSVMEEPKKINFRVDIRTQCTQIKEELKIIFQIFISEESFSKYLFLKESYGEKSHILDRAGKSNIFMTGTEDRVGRSKVVEDNKVCISCRSSQTMHYLPNDEKTRKTNRPSLFSFKQYNCLVVVKYFEYVYQAILNFTIG